MKHLYDFSVIDIETTGLDSRFDDITELAAVRVRNGQIVDSFQELVKPSVPIPHFLEEKTHITNAMVQNARTQELDARDHEVMSWFPDGFKPIQKTFYPKDYEERWAFVKTHPFTALSGAIVSITGDSSVMPRITAENAVAKLGATLKCSTTRNCDFCVALNDSSSGKLSDAKRWQEKGSPIRIINDQQFVDLVKASIEEVPPSPEDVLAYKTEIEERRRARAAEERSLREWIKANLKKKMKPEELHLWRQSFSELWNQILSDDVIEPHELEELKKWLLNHMRKCSDYGAMFKLIDNVVADGVVDYDESLQLFDAAQKCLETMGAAKASANESSQEM